MLLVPSEFSSYPTPPEQVAVSVPLEDSLTVTWKMENNPVSRLATRHLPLATRHSPLATIDSCRLPLASCRLPLSCRSLPTGPSSVHLPSYIQHPLTAVPIPTPHPRPQRTINASYIIELTTIGLAPSNDTSRRKLLANFARSPPLPRRRLASAADIVYTVPPDVCSPEANSTSMLFCTFVANSIVPNTEYAVSITARNEIGSTRTQEQVAAQTLPSSPDAPDAFATSAAMPTTLSFSWRVPINRGNAIFGYFLNLKDEFNVDMYVTFDAAGVMQYQGSSTHTCATLKTQLNPPYATAAAEGSQLQYTVTGLTTGVDFLVNIKACNTLGTSDGACVCGSAATDHAVCPATSCNSTQAVPPHTTGIPDIPLPPTQINGLALQDSQKHSVFVEFDFPYDNEVGFHSTGHTPTLDFPPLPGRRGTTD